MCSHSGCRTIVRDGNHRCTLHRFTPRRKQTLERSKFYNRASWVRLSKSHRQQYPVCEICNKELSVDCDHMVELVLTDEHSLNPDNLIAVCCSCHHTKSMKMRQLIRWDNKQEIYLWLTNHWSPRSENKNLLNRWITDVKQIQNQGETPT
ncbi:HNH endonuclease [Shewanella oncorhynchi]|uniref:HNH endonuclease n=1 Tax=Shewanella oncorhynchi TaxID=2726434 RepID=UPI003524E86E